ncbi:MAG: hypothetical protein BWZ09_02754 [Alphaproteobacteria bacterium ADurb.BinA305]|nr:MAG: hypothetical protein BWZ09_02754 [Alphaproteobacteria bacterium ADurb.BinA305]
MLKMEISRRRSRLRQPETVVRRWKWSWAKRRRFPIQPAASSTRAASSSGIQRRFWFTASCTPAASAACTNSAASASDSPKGFSQRTWTPASKAGINTP